MSVDNSHLTTCGQGGQGGGVADEGNARQQTPCAEGIGG